MYWQNDGKLTFREAAKAAKKRLINGYEPEPSYKEKLFASMTKDDARFYLDVLAMINCGENIEDPIQRLIGKKTLAKMETEARMNKVLITARKFEEAKKIIAKYDITSDYIYDILESRKGSKKVKAAKVEKPSLDAAELAAKISNGVAYRMTTNNGIYPQVEHMMRQVNDAVGDVGAMPMMRSFCDCEHCKIENCQSREFMLEIRAQGYTEHDMYPRELNIDTAKYVAGVTGNPMEALEKARRKEIIDKLLREEQERGQTEELRDYFDDADDSELMTIADMLR